MCACECRGYREGRSRQCNQYDCANWALSAEGGGGSTGAAAALLADMVVLLTEVRMT